VIVPYMIVCLLNGFIKNVDLVCFNVMIKPLSMVTLRNTSVYMKRLYGRSLIIHLVWLRVT